MSENKEATLRTEADAPDDNEPAGDPAPGAPVQAVGPLIRRIRQEKGVSLQELARISGVSVGMLSQVERDLANPSLRVLTNIRNALGLPASAFFSETAPPPAKDPSFVRRADQRPRLELGYLSKELLSAGTPHNLQMMILHIPPKSSSGDKPMRYPAEKAGFVLSGEFILRVGEEEAHLMEGDSFVFDSSIPHSFSNPGTELAKVLWIIGSISVDRHL